MTSVCLLLWSRPCFFVKYLLSITGINKHIFLLGCEEKVKHKPAEIKRQINLTVLKLSNVCLCAQTVSTFMCMYLFWYNFFCQEKLDYFSIN